MNLELIKFEQNKQWQLKNPTEIDGGLPVATIQSSKMSKTLAARTRAGSK